MMFRTVATAAFAVVLMTQSALAGDQARTILSGETAKLTVGESAVTAFHAPHDGALLVTVFVTDADGEMFQSRVRLTEGQAHTISVIADAQGDATYRYSLKRIGDSVAISGDTVYASTEIALTRTF